MPEIHPVNGNYHIRQDTDVYWSVYDRLFTPFGTRQALPGYGFPTFTWPQLTQQELQDAVLRALGTDALIDRVGFDRNADGVTVAVETDERQGGW